MIGQEANKPTCFGIYLHNCNNKIPILGLHWEYSSDSDPVQYEILWTYLRQGSHSMYSLYSHVLQSTEVIVGKQVYIACILLILSGLGERIFSALY